MFKNNEYIEFKERFSLKKRLEESKRIIEKYSERIPVIVEKQELMLKI